MVVLILKTFLFLIVHYSVNGYVVFSMRNTNFGIKFFVLTMGRGDGGKEKQEGKLFDMDERYSQY